MDFVGGVLLPHAVADCSCWHIRITQKTIDFSSLMLPTSSSYCRNTFSRPNCAVIKSIVTHAGHIAAGVGSAFRRVCLSVCLSVRALKRKRLELSTPNLVHVYSIAVARHSLTQRSKGQRSRSHGTKTVTAHGC